MKARFLDYWKKLPRWICVVVFVMVSLPVAGCGSAEDGQENAALLLSAAVTTKMADGMVYGTGVGTNIWATWRVMSSAPSTVALMDPTRQYVIFGAPTARDMLGNSNWWFTLADVKKFQLTSDAIKQLPELGNIANGSTFSGVVNTAQRMGWTVVKPDELPWAFRLSLLSAMKFLAYSASQTLTDFLAIPILDNGDGWKEPLIDYLPTDT